MSTSSTAAPRLSLVVPIYNEEAVLPELLRRTQAALAELGCSYELIFVDDGSTDGSAALLREATASAPIRVVRLSRNFGLQPAVTAGLAHARGEIVGVMDGDLQDPPELLPRMLEQIDAGHDVVYMIKRSRKDPLLRRLGFRCFYWLFRLLSRTPVPPTAGLFSLMRRRALRAVLECPEQRKFIPGLRAWVGFAQVGIPFARDERVAGRPRQSMGQLIRLALDAIYSFTDLPLKAALLLGFTAALLSFLAVLTVTAIRVFTTLAIPGWASNLVATFFMGGVQLICIGILGEYISRIYDEVRRRPQYVVLEVVEPAPQPSASLPTPSPAVPGAPPHAGPPA